MLEDQILHLTEREEEKEKEIKGIEETLKKAKAELVVYKKARLALESAQKALNGQADISA